MQQSPNGVSNYAVHNMPFAVSDPERPKRDSPGEQQQGQEGAVENVAPSDSQVVRPIAQHSPRAQDQQAYNLQPLQPVQLPNQNNFGYYQQQNQMNMNHPQFYSFPYGPGVQVAYGQHHVSRPVGHHQGQMQVHMQLGQGHSQMHQSVHQQAYQSMQAQVAPPNREYGTSFPSTSAATSPRVFVQKAGDSGDSQHDTLETVAPGAPLPTENIKVEVYEKALWQEFYDIGNEMVLTKKGRKLFPQIGFTITGLDPKLPYNLALSFERADDNRYKYSGDQWKHIGKGETRERGQFHYHSDTMQRGEYWMKQDNIKFDKVKVTNYKDPKKPLERWLVYLRSMHRYTIYLHILRGEDDDPTAKKLIQSCKIETMEFITVTAYNNDRIKDKKVDHNKYAKGFRPEGKHTTKKRHGGDQENEPSAKIKREEHVMVQQAPMVPTGAMPQGAYNYAPATHVMQPQYHYSYNQAPGFHPFHQQQYPVPGMARANMQHPQFQAVHGNDHGQPYQQPNNFILYAPQQQAGNAGQQRSRELPPANDEEEDLNDR
uniref:T-box domain-containing protein n=1 Tax=Steinernema glaseri TaxID=37863 RepID=A0A1I7YT59_9BILA